MNYVDAICIICEQHIHWLSGNPRLCTACRRTKRFTGWAEFTPTGPSLANIKVNFDNSLDDFGLRLLPPQSREIIRL
jgi:hypothetical protein